MDGIIIDCISVVDLPTMFPVLQLKPIKENIGIEQTQPIQIRNEYKSMIFQT